MHFECVRETEGVFQSTPSSRRETRSAMPLAAATLNFNPLPPRGGRQMADMIIAARLRISIHSLLAEGDCCR